MQMEHNNNKQPSIMNRSELPLDHLTIFRRAAAVLTSSLELEQALSNTISLCLPALGDFGFFDVVLDESVRRTARAYDDAELEKILSSTCWQRQEREDINLCALSSGTAVLHSNTDDAWFAAAFNHQPRWLPFNSMLSVPLTLGDDLIGSLTLFMGRSGRHHTEDDLQFAAELAALAAPVVAHARALERERKAQQALQISEERLRIATDAGQIGIWEWDIASDTISWSDRVYQLHGLNRENFTGRLADYALLLHPEDRDGALRKIQAAVAQGDLFTNEFRTIWPDGSIHWLSTWARVHRDVQGKALRMVGSSIDITARKQTEAALSERNRGLEARVVTSTSERDRIWRMSQDILAVASFNGYLISVSPAFNKILGWDEAEVRRIPYMELVYPDQREQVTLKLAELAEGARLEGYEIQIRHKKGHYRWISWTVVPEGDLLYGVGRDITEMHRQRTHILNASEMRLQLALEVGRMGAWQWDMASNQVTWWPGMDRLHGLPSGYCLERVEDYLEFVHPEDLEKVRTNMGNNARGVNSSGIEYRIVWPDGSIHWLEGRGDIFLDERGTPELMAGICVDITKRKRTEQDLRFLAQASAELAELEDSAETLRRIAHLAVPHFADWCAVDLVDEQGGLKRVAVAHSDPAKVALGYQLYERYPPDPAEQQGVWQIIRSGKPELIPEISDELLAASISDPDYLNALRQLGLRSYLGVPLPMRGKTLGAIMFVSAESRRIYNTEDLALAEDIASRAATAIENARLYRSLKEADRRKDDFLAMLAHELRNPLSPIGAAADLLQLPLSEEHLRNTGNVISRQVKHMSELVDDLLDVSRVTRGQVTLDRQPVDIRQAVSAAVEQVRPLIEKRLHQLTLAIGSGPLFVSGDEKRLVQVIANLLNNAARYTPEGGNIELSLESQGDFIEICLTDNGIGMDPELVASAFDLFVQGKRTADRAQGGLGLGLALVKSLVELHEGSVQAFSKGLGQGSCFKVHLQRLAEASSDITPQQSSAPPSPNSLKLLVVDDNQDAADMLVMFLQLMGHAVTNCNTPTAALAQLDAGNQVSFDAVLLDIGLPGMDGYELARVIRQRLAGQTPTLIAISGYGQDKDRDAARAAGIDHYMVKPVDTDQLVALLHSLRGPVS